MSTHARPLAAWLAAASDEELTALFTARGIRSESRWNDFFDAAEALLDPASLGRILPQLTRSEVDALLRTSAGGDPGQEREALIALALLQPDGTVPPAVVAAMAGRPAPAPVASTVDSTQEVPATGEAAAHAAERAFTTVSALADLLLLTRDAPLTLLANGNVSAGEKRQLSESGIPTETVDTLLSVAEAAGLVRADGRRLRLTAEAEGWLRAPAIDRWVRLVEGFRRSLPRGLREQDGGWPRPAAWADAHPWDATWSQQTDVLRERATLLGLIADDGSEPEWATPLREGGPVDGSGLQRMLPAEVDRLFLQNDLSAISPGPLAPAIDVRLRRMAQRESVAQASSYRFTSASIAHALVVGETEQSLLDFLGRLSLTGIPQPLQYLISQTAQRHGLVRVSEDESTGRTRIDSVDVNLVDAMAVDQTLRPLALARDGASLSTRVGRDTVYWALTDARYPATLVGPDGAAIAVDRHPASSSVDASDGEAPFAALIARLRSHQGPDADAAWLDRELEAAVRAKAVLRVTVGMPDGSTRELLLEASGMGGGRLRGRDRAADVERTLPVSSIRAAQIVEA